MLIPQSQENFAAVWFDFNDKIVIINIVEGRDTASGICIHCGARIRQQPKFCPFCGRRLGTGLAEKSVAAKGRRRLLELARPFPRCSAFQHELMQQLFKFRFCPDCGLQISWGPAGFEPL